MKANGPNLSIGDRVRTVQVHAVEREEFGRESTMLLSETRSPFIHPKPVPKVNELQTLKSKIVRENIKVRRNVNERSR